MATEQLTLGVLGDVHGQLTEACVVDLDRRGYDAILAVGDLAAYRPGSGLRSAELLGRLRTPTYVIPGNHDAATLPQLGAEVLGQRGLADRLGSGMEARVAALREALGSARLLAWERVDLGPAWLVAGRPHSFGGPVLNFAGYLARAHGVADLAAARERLLDALRGCDHRPIVLLSHGGPTGLGERRDDPCGRDFHRDEGDWGDPDLGEALAQAREEGLDVRLVAFGHLHHALSGGGRRRRAGALGSTLCVNAARVPRLDRDGRGHHVRVRLGVEVEVDEVFAGPDGDEVRPVGRRAADGRVHLAG
ncbi:MAG: metallophosphoesterase family protein [Alphaproteobacteria bacterium]|nr:metallophosphoesterase family protein [Alphaproteobacteria bacterium]